MHCAFKNAAAFELRRNAEDGAVESVIVGERRLNQGFPPTRENAMQAGSGRLPWSGNIKIKRKRMKRDPTPHR